MSEVVERVARAMAAVDKGDDMWDIVSEDGDRYGYVGKNEYRAMARAAIKAMREATREMVSAVQDRAECFSFGAELLDSDIRSIFALAIDGALK